MCRVNQEKARLEHKYLRELFAEALIWNSGTLI
jgi:hypothetical protein